MTTVEMPRVNPGWAVSRSSLGFRPRWPTSAAHRWSLRLALSLPYVVLAVVADARGITSTPNQQLEQQAALIRWGSDDLSFVSDIYPPIPVAIARVLPSSALWLGIVGALCAGVVLQVLWERLHQRRVGTGTTVTLLASVGAIPAFWYSSTQDVAAFFGMALFTLAIAGMLRFAAEGDTEGGFQCGLAFGAAAMCDPATAVYAFFTGLAAPFVASRRYRDEPGALVATLAVIITPTVAAFAGWAFLGWRFDGTAFASLADDPAFMAFPGGVWDTVVREVGYLLVSVLITPVFLVSLGLMAHRRPVAVGAQLLMLFSILITRIVGVQLGSGQGLVIIACTGVMTVADAPTRTVRYLLGAAAVAQIGLSWLVIRADSPIEVFVHDLF